MFFVVRQALAYDKDMVHHGKTNKYTFLFKEKKITLLPMSPEAILKDESERNSREKESSKSENQIVAKEHVPQTKKEHSARKGEIKLKDSVLLATKSDICEMEDSKSDCYALVCKETLFSFEDMPPSLPPTVAYILQKFANVFPSEIPLGLPPISGIEHQIDLILGASLPNRAPYRTNPEETKEIQR